MDNGSVNVLLQYGALGAMVIIQWGIIVWLITRLTNRVAEQAARIDFLEAMVLHSDEPPKEKL